MIMVENKMEADSILHLMAHLHRVVDEKEELQQRFDAKSAEKDEIKQHLDDLIEMYKQLYAQESRGRKEIDELKKRLAQSEKAVVNSESQPNSMDVGINSLIYKHAFSPHHKHELEQTDEEFFLEVNRNNEELIKARNEIAKMNKELNDLRSILNRQNRKEEKFYAMQRENEKLKSQLNRIQKTFTEKESAEKAFKCEIGELRLILRKFQDNEEMILDEARSRCAKRDSRTGGFQASRLLG